MSNRAWQRTKELFNQAIELPIEQREDFLRQSESDEAIIASVIQLYASESSAPTFQGPLKNLTSAGDRSPGDHYGPFELDTLIGQGGMSDVYLAHRIDGHYEQTVALKLLRPTQTNIDPRSINEHHLLARLQHPCIARLIDAGISERGEPYFAMELVEGIPLLAFCEQNHLSLDARLALFEKVCDAVEHAHRALILHRDLKSDNILVTQSGQPKLLDFGIARILEESSGTAAPGAATQRGFFALTPEYASPEQITGEPLTTATDVYALGVTLYQLLAGNPPYQFERRSPEEIVRVVTESPIELPSRRATLAVVPARRIKGDLDSIVMTAMHRDMSRRYATVQQLRNDVARFRKNLPVSARTDTVVYRLYKFAQRHASIVGVAAVATVLLAGSLLMNWQESRARLQAASKAESISRFMLDLFDSVTPDSRGGDAFSVNMLLTNGMERAESELLDQPEVFHEVMHKIAQTYLALDNDAGLIQAAKLIESNALYLPTDSPFQIDRAHLQATLTARQGSPQYDLDLAVNRFEALVEQLETASSQDKTRLTRALFDTGNVLNVAGFPERAEEVLRRALALAQQAPLSDPRAIQRQLATTYLSRGQLERSLALIFEVIDGAEQWDGGRPTQQQALNQRSAARILQRLGRIDEAVKQSAAAAQTIKLLFGENHRKYGESLLDLAVTFDSAADLQRFQSTSEEAAKVLAAAEPEGVLYWRALKSVGEAKRQLGDFEAAMALTTQALSGLENSDETWLTITTRYQLAKTQSEAELYPAALDTLAATDAALSANEGQHVGPRLQKNFSFLLATKRIQIMILQGRFDDALGAAIALMEAHPEFDRNDRLQVINQFRLALWRAVAYELKGSDALAESTFTEMMELKALLPSALTDEDIAAAEQALRRPL